MFNKNGSRPMYIIKVGNNERPATEEDIADVAEQLSKTQEEDIKGLVTHHAIEVVELQGDSEIRVAGHKDPNQLSLFENN